MKAPKSRNADRFMLEQFFFTIHEKNANKHNRDGKGYQLLKYFIDRDPELHLDTIKAIRDTINRNTAKHFEELAGLRKRHPDHFIFTELPLVLEHDEDLLDPVVSGPLLELEPFVETTRGYYLTLLTTSPTTAENFVFELEKALDGPTYTVADEMREFLMFGGESANVPLGFSESVDLNLSPQIISSVEVDAPIGICVETVSSTLAKAKGLEPVLIEGVGGEIVFRSSDKRIFIAAKENVDGLLEAFRQVVKDQYGRLLWISGINDKKITMETISDDSQTAHFFTLPDLPDPMKRFIKNSNVLRKVVEALEQKGLLPEPLSTMDSSLSAA